MINYLIYFRQFLSFYVFVADDRKEIFPSQKLLEKGPIVHYEETNPDTG